LALNLNDAALDYYSARPTLIYVRKLAQIPVFLREIIMFPIFLRIIGILKAVVLTFVLATY